jgi:ferritin-like metal-binding protein YciE
MAYGGPVIIFRGDFKMQFTSLHNLYIEELKDLRDAEQQILQALPKMVQAATSPELKKAFEGHLEQSREHVNRLEKIFNDLGVARNGVTCQAMAGLLKEGDEVIKAMGDSTVKDAALIAAAQRVEHYEMAVYGTVRTFAREMGYDDAADLLQKTLDEEGDADKKLTKIAEGGFLSDGINEKAM